MLNTLPKLFSLWAFFLLHFVKPMSLMNNLIPPFFLPRVYIFKLDILMFIVVEYLQP